jgi:ATP-dependent Lhr-like helicase
MAVASPSAAAAASVADSPAETWFAARGWQPFGFQREVWAAMAVGESGLLHATTGSACRSPRAPRRRSASSG